MGTTGSPCGAVLLVNSSPLVGWTDVSPTVIVWPGHSSARVRVSSSCAMMTTD